MKQRACLRRTQKRSASLLSQDLLESEAVALRPRSQEAGKAAEASMMEEGDSDRETVTNKMLNGLTSQKARTCNEVANVLRCCPERGAMGEVGVRG